MKTPTNKTTRQRSLRRAGGLVSAALILSLSACDSDSLESDLEDGIEINISTNDDDDIVVSFPED